MLKSALSSQKNPKNEKHFDNFVELKIGLKKKANWKFLKTMATVAFRFIVHRVLSKITATYK